MHSAKGLEFNHVFLVGCEEGLFPGMRTIGDSEEMEEERRLCYVAITRAKKSLTVSYAKQRMLYGKTNAALPSRFIAEIPEDLVQRKGGFSRPGSTLGYGGNSYAMPRYQTTYSVPKTKSSELSSRMGTAPQKTECPEFRKGDMVQHTAFGKGMVLSVLKMGGDALLEIVFDEIGTKKLMAKTASAHMKRL